MKAWRLPAWAVLGTVILFELVVLKDLCPAPWDALLDGVCVVVGLFLAVAIPRCFDGPGGPSKAGAPRVDSLGMPSGPGSEGRMFRYRLHSPDGDDLGEATYAVVIKPGEEIFVG